MAEAAPEVVSEGAVRVLAEAGEVGHVHVPLCERGQHSEAKGHSASWQPLEAVCAALQLAAISLPSSLPSPQPSPLLEIVVALLLMTALLVLEAS